MFEDLMFASPNCDVMISESSGPPLASVALTFCEAHSLPVFPLHEVVQASFENLIVFVQTAWL